MRIVWDEPKRLANIEKHGWDFFDLEAAFFEDAVIRPAKNRRFFAFGRMADRTLAVVFAHLGSEGIAVISMRPAKPAERRLYEQAKRI